MKSKRVSAIFWGTYLAAFSLVALEVSCTGKKSGETATAPSFDPPTETPPENANTTPAVTPTAEATPAIPTRNVRVTWQENREKAVNQVGGGYRVYYSSTPGFDIASAPSILAPYASGAAAPTSAVLALPAGVHYIKVTAMSSLNAEGQSGGSSSEPSTEISVKVP